MKYHYQQVKKIGHHSYISKNRMSSKTDKTYAAKRPTIKLTKLKKCQATQYWSLLICGKNIFCILHIPGLCSKLKFIKKA